MAGDRKRSARNVAIKADVEAVFCLLSCFFIHLSDSLEHFYQAARQRKLFAQDCRRLVEFLNCEIIEGFGNSGDLVLSLARCQRIPRVNSWPKTKWIEGGWDIINDGISCGRFILDKESQWISIPQMKTKKFISACTFFYFSFLRIYSPLIRIISSVDWVLCN